MNKIVDYYHRLRTFIVEVRTELKKVTWPPQKEVQGTTVVVVIAVFFFGFYLFGLDLIMTYVFSALTRLIGS